MGQRERQILMTQKSEIILKNVDHQLETNSSRLCEGLMVLFDLAL